ncbi:MAG TPA: cysteine desulfurase [Firmicutes bacterium]|nr:cysteine desulfurase [Bacillota bacterium]
MEQIYFDNSATTPLSGAARAAMTEALDCFGNPSSLHTLGVEAESRVYAARTQIFAALGDKPTNRLDAGRLIFTASGTEADNLALIGAATAKNFTGKKILVSDSEHPAVLETAAQLERRGFRVVRVPTVGGVPDYDCIAAEADRDTILASFMLVNNETGAVYDIGRISSIVKAANPRALVHTDCVQGFLKVPFTVKSLGADLITLSAHKIGGPKGVGALWTAPGILRAKKLSPVVFGGGQEGGLRSGTENTLGIIGFGAAAAAGSASLGETISRLSAMRERLISALTSDERFEGVKLNLPPNAAPHILSVTLPSIRSEVMLHSLSEAGIYVSSGSACSSNTHHGSYVLRAFGLSDRDADCTIRISLGDVNTQSDAERFLAVFAESLKRLARMR